VGFDFNGFGPYWRIWSLDLRPYFGRKLGCDPPTENLYKPGVFDSHGRFIIA
jgi:hypothetical protein